MLLLALLWSLVAAEDCGGHLTADRGLLTTPSFPRPFPVPLRCLWLITSGSPTASVAVHLTQLYVSTGLTFTEYAYYEPGSGFQLEPRLLHKVTEENLPTTSLVFTSRPFLVVELSLDRLEGNHLRALDGLLDVFGFNLTYSIQTDGAQVPDYSCTVAKCSMLGNCFATADYSCATDDDALALTTGPLTGMTASHSIVEALLRIEASHFNQPTFMLPSQYTRQSFYCSCFPGFSGPSCTEGPLCLPDTNLCKNGATCRHVGARNAVCVCPPGFGGDHCQHHIPLPDCTDDLKCIRQCPYDGTRDAACSCDHTGTAAPQDMSHFETTLRLVNTSWAGQAGKGLETKLQKQMTKYLRTASLSKIEDVKVLNITSGGEARFHFIGSRKDGGRVRELLLGLVERGRLANFTLVPTHFSFSQEPTLLILKVDSNKKEDRVRTGEEFRLSCTAQGTAGLRFFWYKDGVPVNISSAIRKMSLEAGREESGDRRTSLLWVQESEPADEGLFTCQTVDWGVQQCRSLRLSVVQPLRVSVSPISITLNKGSNLTIRCLTEKKPRGRGKVGYNWTKNRALFPMTPGSEFWEDLYPDGTILKLINLQKGATYTCSAAAGGAWTGSATARLEVSPDGARPVECPGSGGWAPSAPGLQGPAPCPPGYTGTASRQCSLIQPGVGHWHLPDYSDCRSHHTQAILNQFSGLRLGYAGTTVDETVWEVATWVSGRGPAWPGEAEPYVRLLSDILGYLRQRDDAPLLINVTGTFVSAVNGLLRNNQSIVNHQTVLNLVETVKEWTLWWGSLSGGTFGHVHQDGVLINTLRINHLQSQLTVVIPRTGFRYPDWFGESLELHLENSGESMESTVAIIFFRDLKQFFPKHFLQILEEGNEIELHSEGPTISVVCGPGLSVKMRLEPATLCATTSSGQHWDLTSCNTTGRGCTCIGPGLVSALTTRSNDPVNTERMVWQGSLRVRVSCCCCLLQSLMTAVVLAARLYRRPSVLLYLKVQSCLSLTGTMAIFISTASPTLPQIDWRYLSCGLQFLLLVAISSQLSKLIIVYSYLIKIPMARYFKQTIVLILTGLPGVCCLSTWLLEPPSPLSWWWLRPGTPSFYVTLVYSIALLSLQVALSSDFAARLTSKHHTKPSKPTLGTRVGLVKRSLVLLIFMSTTFVSSLLYANAPTLLHQTVFSVCVLFMGVTQFMCYTIMSETAPKNVHFLKRFQHLVVDEIYSSTSDNSFFTKQEAEAECEGGAPPDLTAGPDITATQPDRGQELLLLPRSATTPRKCVSFHSDLVTGCAVIEDADSPEQGSPELKGSLVRASYYQNPATDPAQGCLQELKTTRVCLELGLLQESSEAPPTLMVCNVDIEPSSRMVSPGMTPGEEVPRTDVLGRISDDLDYLLEDRGLSNQGQTAL